MESEKDRWSGTITMCVCVCHKDSFAALFKNMLHVQTHTDTETNQEGTLGVEGVSATRVDASVTQKLQQADVVVAVGL